MKIWSVIERVLEAHGTCALVSVIETHGSSPREAGARMIVTPEGFHGTIGGGTLEWKALAVAQSLLGKPRAVKTVDQSLGPDLGQCCGGRVKLAIESFVRSNLAEVKALALREEQGRFEIVNRIAGLPLTEHFGEQRRRVYVFGAGHVGRALVLALAPLPFDVIWADPRPEAFPGAVPSNATIAHGDPLRSMNHVPPASLAFILSHSHALDLELANAALRIPAFAHVGVIGSLTKRARFEKRLREAGVDPARVSEMICPIGTGGIRSKLPAAIAVSATAQIIALHESLEAREEPAHTAIRTTG